MAEWNLNFDHVIDRRNTYSLKYDFAKKRGKPEDILPLWVADMDFQTSSYIVDALDKALCFGDRGIFRSEKVGKSGSGVKLTCKPSGNIHNKSILLWFI